MVFGRLLVVLVVALAPVLPLGAGEVEVQYVTAKQSTDMLPVKSEADAIKQYGETVGKQMWQMMAASVQDPIPATYIKQDDLDIHTLYDAPWQYFYAVAGFKVEDGRSVKPGAFETGINSLEADLSLEPGDYVRILKTFKGKKNFDLLVAPVCRTASNHSALRSVFRVALKKAELEGLDPESADRLVRPWLEPVPVAEVSKTCGPNSGTLVKTWDSSTTVANVESQLGTSDVRVETPEGEVVDNSVLNVFGGSSNRVFAEGEIVRLVGLNTAFNSVRMDLESICLFDRCGRVRGRAVFMLSGQVEKKTLDEANAAVVAVLEPTSLHVVARQCSPSTGLPPPALRPGMPEQQVTELLGPPDVRHESGGNVVFDYGFVEITFREGIVTRLHIPAID